MANIIVTYCRLENEKRSAVLYQRTEHINIFKSPLKTAVNNFRFEDLEQRQLFLNFYNLFLSLPSFSLSWCSGYLDIFQHDMHNTSSISNLFSICINRLLMIRVIFWIQCSSTVLVTTQYCHLGNDEKILGIYCYENFARKGLNRISLNGWGRSGLEWGWCFWGSRVRCISKAMMRWVLTTGKSEVWVFTLGKSELKCEVDVFSGLRRFFSTWPKKMWNGLLFCRVRDFLNIKKFFIGSLKIPVLKILVTWQIKMVGSWNAGA